ncbi:phosphatidylglycerol lysyltransferase domain-containing protein [Henriciella sp. AS95]|uniref:phosphatidylglycerol lysyltransferase domain-containing protein n=1 Tax=Henriciella sp. AS95 TaxID=3135782 RepID=UPI00317CEFA0
MSDKSEADRSSAGETKGGAARQPTALQSLIAELRFVFAPTAFSIITALAAVLVMVALTVPAAAERIPGGLPVPVLEASHFVSSFAATVLLLLSFGIRRRLHMAWLITVAVYGLLAATSFLVGHHILLTAGLVLAGLGLFASRDAFYRRGTVAGAGVSIPTIISLIIIVSGIAWLGFFAYRNVEYRDDLWWTFATDADASRFLRALVIIVSTLVLFVFWRVLSQSTSPALPERTPELDRKIAAVVSDPRTPQPDAALAFLPDKHFHFTDEGDAFAMFGVRGRNWIVMGPPMGPPDRARTLAFDLMRRADRARANLVFYAVPTGFLPIALDLGLSARKIGETAIIPLETFTLAGPARAKLRHAVSRMERENGRFEMLPPGSMSQHGAAMKSISDAWLAHHSGAEKRFTLGAFDEAYLDRQFIATIWYGDDLAAFANVWQSGDGKTLCIDLMRNRPDALAVTMDALFTQLALWGREQGAVRLDLGMAPLSGLATEREANALSRLGNFIYSHGEDVYGFEGLRRYKNKFDPVWEPLYLCGPERQNLAIALADVAILTSGGLRGMIYRPKKDGQTGASRA